VLVLSGAGAAREASPASAEGILVYLQYHGLSVDVVAVNADGSGETNLTPGDGGVLGDVGALESAVSPDRTKIAFVSTGKKIVVTSAAMTEGRRIGVDGALDLAWAPDSRHVAYTTRRPDELHVVKTDGTGDRVLAREQMNIGLSWSPDGSAIAYATEAGLKAVSFDGARHSTLAATGDVWRPAWSPDGRRIAFTNWAGDVLAVADDDGTRVLIAAEEGGGGFEAPSWSPDGRQLAIGVRPADAATVQIYGVDADSGAMKQLTHTISGEDSTSPVWSPDGRRIAYLRNRWRAAETADIDAWPGADVWVMTSDTGDTRPLTRAFPTGATVLSAPAWLSDERRVVPDATRLRTKALRSSRVLRTSVFLSELDAEGARAAFTSSQLTGVQTWSAATGERDDPPRLLLGDTADRRRAALGVGVSRTAGRGVGLHVLSRATSPRLGPRAVQGGVIARRGWLASGVRRWRLCVANKA
jgi:Tol biopolymer transport system component